MIRRPPQRGQNWRVEIYELRSGIPDLTTVGGANKRPTVIEQLLAVTSRHVPCAESSPAISIRLRLAGFAE